jgi:phage-related tail protein
VIERRITSKYFKVSSSKWLPLLTPIVWSAEKRLRGESRPRKNLYVARGGGAYIDAEIAEQNLINKLSDIQFPQQMRDEIKRQIIAQTSDERRAALKKQYDDLGDERTRLLQLFLKKQVQLADYDTEYKRIEQALAAIQSELDKPSDVERVLGQLGDLASTIKLMSREAQRRTIHRLFDRIELDENGEVIGGNVKPWLFLALNEVAVAILAHTPAMGSVGNNPATGVSKFPPSTVWLATLRPRF